MFCEVKARFGKVDIFVASARPEAAEFFTTAMDITLQQWDTAFDSQAKAFLIVVRVASALMPEGGRVISMTYAQGSRTGGLQPWVGMGSAKAAMESLVRYFAVALAKCGITINAISPGWTENSVLNSLPDQVQAEILPVLAARAQRKTYPTPMNAKAVSAPRNGILGEARPKHSGSGMIWRQNARSSDVTGPSRPERLAENSRANPAQVPKTSATTAPLRRPRFAAWLEANRNGSVRDPSARTDECDARIILTQLAGWMAFYGRTKQGA